DAATARAEASAEAATIRLGAWLGGRKAELRQIALDATNRIGVAGVNGIVARPADADPSFEAIEIVSPTGKVMSITQATDTQLRDAPVVTLANALSIESLQPICL